MSDDRDAEIARLTAALAEAESRAQVFKCEADAAEARVWGLEKRCEALDDALAGAQHARDEARDEVAQLRETLEAEKHRTAEEATAIEDLAQLRERVAELERTLNAQTFVGGGIRGQ